MAHTEHRSDDKTVASNRKARHDYTLVEMLECGIQLTGTEVKSLRLGQASLVRRRDEVVAIDKARRKLGLRGKKRDLLGGGARTAHTRGI